ncbi:hypothetical protein MKEN_00450500 [Mycena kentingensis (nom. inval.)]|nr:hypothetical protein MKEN_00450500 [Mycena kentingensis (nom. inval.)]
MAEVASQSAAPQVVAQQLAPSNAILRNADELCAIIAEEVAFAVQTVRDEFHKVLEAAGYGVALAKDNTPILSFSGGSLNQIAAHNEWGTRIRPDFEVLTPSNIAVNYLKCYDVLQAVLDTVKSTKKDLEAAQKELGDLRAILQHQGPNAIANLNHQLELLRAESSAAREAEEEWKVKYHAAAADESGKRDLTLARAELETEKAKLRSAEGALKTAGDDAEAWKARALGAEALCENATSAHKTALRTAEDEREKVLSEHNSMREEHAKALSAWTAAATPLQIDSPSALATAISHLTRDAHAAKTKSTALDTNLTVVRRSLAAAEKRVTELNESVSELQKQSSDQSAESEKRLSSLDIQLAQIKEQLGETERERDRCRTELSDVHAKRALASDAIKTLENERRQLQQDCAKLKAERDQLKAAQNTDINALRVQFQETQAISSQRLLQNHRLQAECNQLKEVQRVTSQQLAQIQELQAERDASLLRSQLQSAELQRFQHAAAELRAQLANAQTLCADRETGMQQLAQERDQVRADAEALLAHFPTREVFDGMQKQLKQYATNEDKHATELRTVKGQLTGQCRAFDVLTEQMATMNKAMDKLKAEVTSSELKRLDLEAEILELRADNGKMTESVHSTRDGAQFELKLDKKPSELTEQERKALLNRAEAQIAALTKGSNAVADVGLESHQNNVGPAGCEEPVASSSSPVPPDLKPKKKKKKEKDPTAGMFINSRKPTSTSSPKPKSGVSIRASLSSAVMEIDDVLKPSLSARASGKQRQKDADVTMVDAQELPKGRIRALQGGVGVRRPDPMPRSNSTPSKANAKLAADVEMADVSAPDSPSKRVTRHASSDALQANAAHSTRSSDTAKPTSKRAASPLASGRIKAHRASWSKEPTPISIPRGR